MHDDGGTDGRGVDTLVRSFVVQVAAVNDAPSFTAGPNQRVASQAGPQTISGWAKNFRPGPANEAEQKLVNYSVVSNSAPELFRSAPVIDISGTLTYTPKPNEHGVATIGVVARDDGGTITGGIDTSVVHQGHRIITV